MVYFSGACWGSCTMCSGADCGCGRHLLTLLAIVMWPSDGEASSSCWSWHFLYPLEGRETLGFTVVVATGRQTCPTSILWSWDSSAQVFAARGSDSTLAWLEEWWLGHLTRLGFSWSFGWRQHALLICFVLCLFMAMECNLVWHPVWWYMGYKMKMQVYRLIVFKFWGV